MYAYIKYSNKNVKSNYQRFGVTFNQIEQEFDIIKDFDCENHQFVEEKAGKKKYWKDAKKRAIHILGQLMIDPNLTVNVKKGADKNTEENIKEVLEYVSELKTKRLIRDELAQKLPDNRKAEKQNAERLKTQADEIEDLRKQVAEIDNLKKQIEELNKRK
jgi:small-conductance mechanosensitive channel